MLKLNVAGPGVTATVKALWKGGKAGFANEKEESSSSSSSSSTKK